MIFKFLKIIGIGYLLSVSTLANATFIDNGDYTTDTESGLDWLDWTETINMTQSEALIDFSGAGWRIATSTEATALIQGHFDGQVDPLSGYSALTDFSGYHDKRDTFNALFGITYGSVVSWVTIEGFGRVGVSKNWLWNGNGGDVEGQVGYNNSGHGVPLVKATSVSAPASITLLALGFVGIGFARRRQC
jgi:hypothetical protein